MSLERPALAQAYSTVPMDVKPASYALLISILSRREPPLLPVLDEPTPARADVLRVLEEVDIELATYGFDDRYRSLPTAPCSKTWWTT